MGAMLDGTGWDGVNIESDLAKETYYSKDFLIYCEIRGIYGNNNYGKTKHTCKNGEIQLKSTEIHKKRLKSHTIR